MQPPHRKNTSSTKVRLGVLFGGQSCEHEVSVISARSMLAALDPDKYDVTLIGIAKDGRWRLAGDPTALASMDAVDGDELPPVLLDYSENQSLVAAPVQQNRRDGQDTVPVPSKIPAKIPAKIPTGEPIAPLGPLPELDVIFPILHGPNGEDGTVQGLLELTGLPYVGSGVLGSAVGMDKAMMKRAFRAEGLPLLEYLVVHQRELAADIGAVEREAATKLGYPMFVKPLNLGSSVGVHRIDDAPAFETAVRDAASYDVRVMIERAAPNCREIECAVLGNDAPAASVLGEIVSSQDFYSYEAKYLDGTSATHIPADLPAELTARLRQLALDAFRAVDAMGLARVDFFVDAKSGEAFVNEINTMPGFTPISMFPQLWAASGVPYATLIDRLIELAIERHNERASLRRAL